MRYLKQIIFLCSVGTSFAQVKFNGGSLMGYESNINKNPKSYILNGDLLESDQTYQSSFYQDIFAKFQYKKEWSKVNFKLYISPRGRFFLSESESNHWQLPVRAQITKFYKNKIKWESNAYYKYRKRDGFDLDQNELSIPFGYSDYTINTGIHFRPYESNRMYFKVYGGLRDFDTSPTRDVTYIKYGAELQTKHVFWSNHLLHSIGLNVGFTNRDYSIKVLSNNSNSKRQWQYIDAEAFYKYPFSKQFYIKPIISYQKRLDNTDHKFGYSQWKAELRLQYKLDDFLIGFQSSYASRIFEGLSAKDLNEDDVGSLKYEYIKLRLNTEYKVFKKWFIIGDAYINNRLSNNTDITTTAYRAYDNYYAGIGIKFKF